MFKKLCSKKIMSFVVTFSMVFGLMIPGSVQAKEISETNTTTSNKAVDISIITYNDFHGALKESGKNVGAAKFVGEVKALKSKNPNNTIVVSAGDMYQGSALSNLLKGAPVNAMNKELGLDLSAVGNHEFDWGYSEIPKWAKEGNFQFLASNIYEKETGKPVSWAKPYAIIEKAGKKIGFIGLSTQETKFKTNPASVANLEFRNPTEAAKHWTEYLRNEKKVDAVIILSHIASEQNPKTGEITGYEIEPLTKIKGVDAIVSGHSHMPVNGKLNGMPIVQAYKNGRCLGYINLNFDKDGKLTVDSTRLDIYKDVKNLPVDKHMEELLKGYEAELAPVMDVKVADLSVDLPHDRDAGVTPMGATVAETMRRIANTDVAIENGGGVRAPLEKGVVTVGDMYTIMPFDNTLVTMDMKGSDIVKVLEHGIAPKDKAFGWGQHAGVKFWYNPKAEAGHRITSVRLPNGSKLDPNKYYSLVTNDFLVEGGDMYDFSAAKNVKNTNIPVRDAIKDYWHKNGIDPITNLATLIVPGKDTTDEIKPVTPEKPVVDGDKDQVKPVVPEKPVVKPEIPVIPEKPAINEDNNINPSKPIVKPVVNPDDKVLDGNNSVMKPANTIVNSNKEVKGTSESNEKTLPKTGSPIGAGAFATVGIVAVAGGIFTLKRKKHNKAA